MNQKRTRHHCGETCVHFYYQDVWEPWLRVGVTVRDRVKRRTFGVKNWVEQKNSQRARTVAVTVFRVAWHPNFHVI